MRPAALVLVALVGLFYAWQAHAQQMAPELESQRVYVPFKDAAPRIFAAAIARANRGTTDPVASVEQSYDRALEYSKHSAVKINYDLGGAKFSFFSWLPALMLGEINAETVQLKVNYGSMTGAAAREAGAFNYKLRQQYQTPFTADGPYKPARIYTYDQAHTFRTEPVLQGTTVVYTNRCTGTTANQARCAAPNYVPGSFKWYWRGPSQPVIHACNEISDCVQSAISFFFYLKTYKYKTAGYDDAGQYWGNYLARPATSCADSAEFSYLQSTTSGVLCSYSLTFEWLSGFGKTVYAVSDDDANGFLSYITVNPVPIVCPGATKYPQFVACDKRFADDAITPKTLARLVDQLFYWGSYREGYRGHKYTPVTAADVQAALGTELVKLSSLADEQVPPVLLAPTTPASGAGSGGLDLGPNPGNGTPQLEQMDAASILAPLWGLFPSLRSYTVAGHASQCPAFTPSVFGASLNVTAHCGLLEGQRGAIGALSLLAWAGLALTIVLRA